MIPKDFLKDVTARIQKVLPSNLQTIKTDWDKTIHTILTNAFTKLDLVTRAEFDTQTKVLARTREKVEQLEIRVQELEKIIHEKPTE